MNRRAYILGVVMVLLCSAVAVALRTFAEAAFLSAYGPAQMPWLLIANAGGFAIATLGYDAITRRAQAMTVDLALLGMLAVLGGAAPALLRAGASPIVLVVGLAAGSQVAGLALWNRVAASVAGRDARRALPRAGAAVTAGGALAGLSAGAIIPRLGLAAIPYAGAALTLVVAAVCLAQDRALASGGSPGATAPAEPPRGSGLAQHRLLAALVAVAVLEGMVATVVDLQFIARVKARYTGDDVAVALALFYGGTNAILFLLQAAAAPRLLVTRSLTFTAAIHPLLVIASYAWFIASPGFVPIAGTRTCDSVLRLATSRPAQELALSALPPVPRARWKVLLRGTIWPGGAASAALVLLLVGPRPPVQLALAAMPVALVAAILARTAARRFQAALAAPLGIRTTRRDDPRSIDLDTLEQWTRATGDADPKLAALARAALARARVEPSELADHLRHDEPAVRAALYAQLARTPAAELRGELRTAIAIEDDDAALVAGIHALAILGDRAGIERAEERAGLAREVDDAARTARVMLVDADTRATPATGRSDHGRDASGHDDDLQAELARVIERDPPWAAALVRVRRPALAEPALSELLAAHRPAAYAVIARVCAGLPLLATALEAGEPAALAAIADLDEEGARTLAVHVADLPPLARLAIARTAAATPAGVHVVAVLVDDADPEVAYAALRSALALARGGVSVSASAIAAAHVRALAALAAHLDARDSLATDLACARAEVELATRRCAARLLWASALEAAAAGRDPAALAATARHLVGGRDADRKRALDVAQELQARSDVLAAIERWLRAPAGVPAAHIAGAHAAHDAPGAEMPRAATTRAAAVLAPHDAWLARLVAGALRALEPTLVALRRPALLASLAGPALAALAERAGRRTVDGDLFRAGESGDAMYVVVRGALVARRDADDRRIEAGEVVGELAVLTHAPRAATVSADGTAEVLAIDRDAFAAAARRAPELVLGLSATLAGWLAPNRPDAL